MEDLYKEEQKGIRIKIRSELKKQDKGTSKCRVSSRQAALQEGEVCS